MNGEATLVTGANGFVGSEIVRQLQAQGASVRGAVRSSGASPALVAVGAIDGATDWSRALDGIGRVIHCAARVHQMDDAAVDPLAAFRRVNRDGTANLARQAAAAGVRRLVFLSTIKVNGEHTRGRSPFAAGDPAAPCDAYAQSKWEAEQALHAVAAQTTLEIAIVRPPLVYGPGVRANFARLVRLATSGYPLPFGRCTNRRSMISVQNLASLAIAASCEPGAAGATLLASDGEAVPVAELMRRIAAAWGRPARLLPVPVALLRLAGALGGQRAAIDRLCDPLEIDPGETLARLDWRPQWTMQQVLAGMAAREGTER